MTLNRGQKRVLEFAAVAIITAALAPPWMESHGGAHICFAPAWSREMNWAGYARVNTRLLVAEWFGILLVTGLMLLRFTDER